MLPLPAVFPHIPCAHCRLRAAEPSSPLACLCLSPQAPCQGNAHPRAASSATIPPGTDLSVLGFHRRLQIEDFEARIALMPLLQAEKDRR